MRRPRDLLEAGVWIWGAVTALLGAFLLIVLLSAAFSGDTQNNAYKVVSANNGVLGPMIAASALVWSWFFQMHLKRDGMQDTTTAETQSTDVKPGE